MARQLPSISHPTGRPNFTSVQVGDLTCWFSYRTVIAFHTPETGTVVSENVWSKTTGKHINYVDDRRDRRVPREMFERMLSAAVAQGEAPEEPAPAPAPAPDAVGTWPGGDGHHFDPSVGDAEIAAWNELLRGDAVTITEEG